MTLIRASGVIKDIPALQQEESESAVLVVF